MTEKISREEQDAINQFHDLMVKKMKKGKSKAQIVEELVADGYNQKEAQVKVNEGWKFVMDLVEGERFTSRAVLPAILGGLIGAAVGAGFWGAIVYFTSLESTWMATGVGVIVGFSMMLFTKGKRGWLIKLIALLFSIVGIFSGKYIMDYLLLKTRPGFFSEEMFEIFLEGFDKSLDGASGVWVFLALVAAWKMTSSLGIKSKKREK